MPYNLSGKMPTVSKQKTNKNKINQKIAFKYLSHSFKDQKYSE